jgi:uncharacterized protein YecT (DUF1311 family)
VARNDCRVQQLRAEEATMERYLSAATMRAGASGLAPEALEAEQAAWQGYRKVRCGNVHALWAGGTIRSEMAALCQLDLIRTRTHQPWSAYLTHMDSTPPVLPEPAR